MGHGLLANAAVQTFSRYGSRTTTHRPKVNPSRRNRGFAASTMPPCAIGIARRSPRAPYRTAEQPAALRKCMPVARRDGFYVRSHSARAVKVGVRPGSSRHSNLITVKVSDPVPTSPAALDTHTPPRDLPALLSWPQAQLKRRLQRPAGADQHSTCPQTNVSAIVSRMICCTHFHLRAHRTRASRHLRPQTASARFKPFAAANGSNHDLRCPVSTARCGLVHVIIIAINDSHREWRGSRVKTFRAW